MPHPAVIIVERALAQRATAQQIVDRLIEAGHMQGVPSHFMAQFDGQLADAIKGASA